MMKTVFDANVLVSTVIQVWGTQASNQLCFKQ